MSTLSEEGVMAVKQTCCDRLLASRVEQKLQVRGVAWGAGFSVQGLGSGASTPVLRACASGHAAGSVLVRRVHTCHGREGRA